LVMAATQWAQLIPFTSISGIRLLLNGFLDRQQASRPGSRL